MQARNENSAGVAPANTPLAGELLSVCVMICARAYRERDLLQLTLSALEFHNWRRAQPVDYSQPFDRDAALSECLAVLSDSNPGCPADDLDRAARSLCAYGLYALQDDFTPPAAKTVIRAYVATLALVAEERRSVARQVAA